MSHHDVQRMYVVQFEATDHEPPLQPAPRASVASLNTHDMPTFTAYWNGDDVADRVDLGLLDADGAKATRAHRSSVTQRLARYIAQQLNLPQPPTDARSALRGALALLARGPARLVLVNLEDLLGETQPQNTPGTWQERANWQRKARRTLEETRALSDVTDTLREVNNLRARKTVS